MTAACGEAAPDARSDLAATFEDIAGSLSDLFGAPATLQPEDVVEFARRAVPHTQHEGLTVVRGGSAPTTLAATGETPRTIDRLQYEYGEGPCLEALEHSDLVEAVDLRDEPQWPAFAHAAVEQTPVRSMVGVRLVLGDGERGALNFYAERPSIFTATDRAIVAICSTVASLVLQRDQSVERARNLEYALEASRQIGMAMGVLMARRLLTQEQAMEELRTASNALHRRLRDVAEEVIATGEVPQRPPRRR